MKKQVRTITEGSMMLAIIGLFLFLNLQLAGLLQVYLIWAVPLPIIFYVAKFGIRNGFVLSAAALILSFIIGNIVTLFYMGTAITVGMIYGYGIRTERSNIWLLISTTLLTAVSFFIEMVLLASFFGYDIIRETNEIITYLGQIEGLVIPDDMATLVLAVYPVAFLLMAFLQAFITHIVATVLLKRLNIVTRKMKPLNYFKLPKWIGAIALVGLFTGSLLSRVTDQNIRMGITFILVVSMMTILMDAFVLITIYARKTNRKFIPSLALIGIFLLPSILIYVYIGLGLLDIFTDFRERIEEIKISS